MTRLKYIIVKHHKGYSEPEQIGSYIPEASSTSHTYNPGPKEQMTNALNSAKGYSEYIKKHSYHFTEALAEHISKMMVNANGQGHSWGATQVKKALESLGLIIPKHSTLGDLTYLANMYYADLFPDPLKDENSCLKAAYKTAVDPDGYEGMVFRRWTADAIGKVIKVEWEKFI